MKLQRYLIVCGALLFASVCAAQTDDSTEIAICNILQSCCSDTIEPWAPEPIDPPSIPWWPPADDPVETLPIIEPWWPVDDPIELLPIIEPWFPVDDPIELLGEQ